MVQSIHIVQRTPVQALQYALRKHDITLPEDVWESALAELIQALMEIDVSQLIDASRYERNGTRRAYRNGYRDSAWIVNQTNIPLRIPKLRSGTYFPSFLENSEIGAILSDLIFQAYIDHLPADAILTVLKHCDLEATHAQIATVHEKLYDHMESYRNRLLEPRNIQLDLIPVEDNGRERFLALAFDDDGELLDHDITIEADEAFWQDFVRRLDGRIIHGVEYVVVSRVHTVVRYAGTTSPDMALAA